MKTRSFALAIIIAAFVSVASGCYVGYGYDHDHGYHHGYHHDHDRDHDYRGY